MIIQLKKLYICWIILICVIITVVNMKFKVESTDMSPQHTYEISNKFAQLKPRVRFLSQISDSSKTVKHHLLKCKALSQTAIDSVQKFVFFIGYARSGHSIIGSVLDAHPNVVIAHEYSLFHQWLQVPKLHQNKTWLYNVLYNNSQYHSNQGLRTNNAVQKGYTLRIQDLWQGQYQDQIVVIGDKSGGMTTKTYRMNKNKIKRVHMELVRTVEVPVLAIHVVRNPYDNIATMLLYNRHVLKADISYNRPYDDANMIQSQIGAYFNQINTVVEMINVLNLNVIQIYTEDFVTETNKTLQYICSRLELTCTKDYIHKCSESIFKHQSRSRYLVKWTPYLIDLVRQNMKQISFLQRYSFFD